ncbi:LuxR C-terminal-related transcriptional regulator [Streptomyces roseolilacinus]|uniref:LuxR C-terminal-related transcriptional regulator n=1 Tax=Streptomyces roseolilacinus TaxID=66904 RepID=UPI003802A80E
MLAEEKDVYRSGIMALLERIPEVDVISARDRDELFTVAEKTEPHVMIIGSSLLAPNGFELLHLLSGESSLGAVMVADDDTDTLLHRALEAGVKAYLPVSSPQSDFVAAIRAVAEGGAFLPAGVTRRLFGGFRLVPRARDVPAELRLLSAREREVLRLIAKGSNNREIGRGLNLSEATVKSHVSRILAKLHLRDRVHAALFIWQLGLAFDASEDNL